MPTPPVEAVTERTFPTRVLEADRPVLVQFWAPWCAPCRMVTPIVEELAADHALERAVAPYLRPAQRKEPNT